MELSYVLKFVQKSRQNNMMVVNHFLLQKFNRFINKVIDVL